jgi:polysaccharide deacetylase family protein (PEP-CTERM system associated)
VTRTGRPSLIFSVDVEDWAQSSWDPDLALSDYCADNLRRILDLMGHFPGTDGTFFVLGKFAERHPDAVRAIRQAGHEVASHGYGHVEIFRLKRDEFADDLGRSTKVIGDCAGIRPVGYRAPDFSIVGESLWALDVLTEQGYEFDSSIFPIRKARYGIPDWPQGAARVKLGSGAQIIEFPLSTLEWRGRRLPIAGGGYARLLPAWMLTRALRLAHAQLSHPPVFYCHPYEIDPDEFKRLDIAIPAKVRFHQALGRRATARKLRQLFETFECISFAEARRRRPDLPVMGYEAYVLEPGSVHRPLPFEGSVVTSSR